MTPISHLRALLAQGTKRPWAEYMGDIVQHTDSGKGYPLDYYPDSQDIATRCDCGNGGRIDSANVALIVAAVNALPGLLDEVEELRTARAEGLRALDTYRQAAGGWLHQQQSLTAEIETLRASLRYLRRKIDGYDSTFEHCGFDEFKEEP